MSRKVKLTEYEQKLKKAHDRLHFWTNLAFLLVVVLLAGQLTSWALDAPFWAQLAFGVSALWVAVLIIGSILLWMNKYRKDYRELEARLKATAPKSKPAEAA